MSKAAEYRAKAIGHAKLAAISQSEEVCEIHVRIAASFLALADKEAMRDLKPSGYPSVATASTFRDYAFSNAALGPGPHIPSRS